MKSLWIWILLLVIFSSLLALPYIFQTEYTSTQNLSQAKVETPKVLHLSTPEPLKALYMTACVAAAPVWRESLKRLIQNTELNAVVVDIKDYSGNISFRQGANCYISDLKDFIDRLHASEIYVIGRVAVFQDPIYTKIYPELAVKSKLGGIWKDHKGLSFIDVGAKPYWDYILEISHEAYALGFDELNFDYVRYPSDGNMEDTEYSWTVGTSTKPEMLESFFSYLHQNLKDTGIKMSVDIFGMTTTVTSDMGIGQVLEKTLPYFDYVSPMVYPSHYPSGWNGFSNPAEHPYEVIKIAMGSGREREITFNNGTSTPSKLRPWLQDFDLGATYGSDKIQAQIEATYDAGLSSWMLWAASNNYTEEALLPTLQTEH